jgi:hypothetical protein
MTGSRPSAPRWANWQKRRQHFRLHTDEVGAGDELEYDESARETIRVGVRFTYTDRATQEQRVGYFDRRTGRLTSLTGNERRIVTHFVPRRGEDYVRGLQDSDYA